MFTTLTQSQGNTFSLRRKKKNSNFILKPRYIWIPSFDSVFCLLCFLTIIYGLFLTLKRLGGVNLTPSCGFLKNVSSKERVKPWLFVTFNIILKHIFPENFIEFPQVVQKIWRNSLSILAKFDQFFGFLTLLCYKETNDVSL